MKERASDKWLSATLSVLVHGTLGALLVWGLWFYKPAPTPAPRLAIEATIVDPKSLPADALKPAARPAPTPPKPVPPAPEPPPPPPDTAKVEQQRKAEQERVEKERLDKERVEKERNEQARVEKERVEKERVEKEVAAAAAAATVARDKAEKERVEKDRADQAAKQKAADERLQAQRQSELRAQMAAEEKALAARNSTQMQQYLAQIQGRIERAWIRPASARPGLSCEVRIAQVPGGEVVKVQVGSCNGDDAVRQSIEAAAYRASPLPQPADAALFDRELIVTFRPEE